jgi:hypothetical protein
MLVSQSLKTFQQRHMPALFLKLDIARAFDSLSLGLSCWRFCVAVASAKTSPTGSRFAWLQLTPKFLLMGFLAFKSFMLAG